MNKFKKIYLIMLLLISGLSSTWAHSINITDAWVRPASENHNSAVYLKFNNNTDSDVQLISASSPVARLVELHNTIDDHGVMKMRPLKTISCPAGQTTELAPGAMHIMLIGLNQDLKADRDMTIPINLHFDNGQNLLINAPINKSPECCGCHG